MFSQWLTEHDELFKFISAPCEQQQTMQQSKILVGNNVLNPSLCNVDYRATDAKPKMGRKRMLSTLDDVEESPKDYIKKIIHRDVERQRRQEMTGLYQNLRSLIPSQHLEGKRSISDHIDGTVKYIMHMKNKIDELNNRKQKLIENSLLHNPSSSELAAEKPCPEVSDQPIITVVITSRTGMEVTVNTGLKGTLFLSRILKVLISEGVSIKSCISTRVRERQLHVIQSEVNVERNIDPDVLYKKLMGTAVF